MNVKQLYTNQITHMVRNDVPIARHYVGTVPSNEKFHVIERRPIHPGVHQNFPKYLPTQTRPPNLQNTGWLSSSSNPNISRCLIATVDHFTLTRMTSTLSLSTTRQWLKTTGNINRSSPRRAATCASSTSTTGPRRKR